MKDSPSKVDQVGVKVRTANDAVQSIKQLRKEIVEIMSQLLCLAKSKNQNGMLPLCNEMITKTRTLLDIWEPSLVEEMFTFIEKHRIVEETSTDVTSKQPVKISPFRNITQQLGAFDLKSPDLEDFASPTITGPAPVSDFRLNHRRNTSPCVNIPQKSKNVNNNSRFEKLQPFKIYQDKYLDRNGAANKQQFDEVKLDNEAMKIRKDDDGRLHFSETHFDISGEVLSLPGVQTNLSVTTMPRLDIKSGDLNKTAKNNCYNDRNRSSLDNVGGMIVTTENLLKESENEILHSSNEILHSSNEFNAENQLQKTNLNGQNGAFLDTKVNFSPSVRIIVRKVR